MRPRPDREPLTTRRTFMRMTAAAIVLVPSSVAGFGRSAALGIPWAFADTEGAALADFIPHVGSIFSLRPQGGKPVNMTLVEAASNVVHRGDTSTVSGEAFSLLFTGRYSHAVGATPSALSHPSLGNFTMTVLPVGPARKLDQLYEAVIDRRAPV